jgi:hypothetical protein
VARWGGGDREGSGVEVEADGGVEEAAHSLKTVVKLLSDERAIAERPVAMYLALPSETLRSKA